VNQRTTSATATRATTAGSATAAAPRLGLLKAFGAAAAASVVVNWLISAVARGPLGASDDLQGLTPPAFVSLTVIGVLAGAVGWRLITRRSARPAALLRRLVPVVLVLSFIPDVLLLTGDAPGADLVGVLALMAMHVAIVAIAVPLFRRFMPAGD
jgi:hypothetical protein